MPSATRSTTTNDRTETPPALALHGGPKAFPAARGKPCPKVGVEEFLMLAERFGFSPEARKRLGAAVRDADLPPNGPHLGRYHGSAKPPMGERFEDLAREKFGAKYARCASSGTGALHAAMIAVGAGPGREVICPATGFLATGMAAALAGAAPVFCDVDESLQLDPSKLDALITPRTVAVAPTHHWGTVADMGAILEIARRRGIKVIEDCAQAPGASWRGRPVGSIGDLGCFSISCYKIIGGGEGGMLVTNDERLYERASQLIEAGGLWRPDRFAPERYPGELFVGTNYRLSELEAAVNVVQMRKLEGVVARHRAVHARITSRLKVFREIRRQKSNDPAGDIGYQFRCFPQTTDLGRRIADALRAEGIRAAFRGAGAKPDWHVHRDMFPLFANYAENCRAERCPVAADLYDRCVNISFDQWWTPEDCDAVADGMNKVFAAYCAKE